MLDEYGGRPLDWDSGTFIERFYPAETAEAAQFERLLREFCTDESLPKDWHRTKGSAGHITFSGSRIAAAINTSYSADAGYGYGMYQVGALSRSVSRDASRGDMLRYVTGAYFRFGDYNGRFLNSKSSPRAMFSMANNYSKACVLVDFLSRLGCTNVRCYDTTRAMTVPTQIVLTFSPNDEVRACLGIRREMTQQELQVWSSDLKEAKLPHYL